VIGAPCGGGATVKLTDASVSPAIAVTFVGAAGGSTPGGITGSLGADGRLVPEAFVAVTVNVYDVPFTKPLIKTEVGGKLDPASGTTDTGATAGPAVLVVTV
jgi:hypothetical protein